MNGESAAQVEAVATNLEEEVRHVVFHIKKRDPHQLPPAGLPMET
jgi:hypothetical protein